MANDDPNRPSKKQRELLQFIDGFVKGYGYGPSYREIMRALGYKSVSTVAIHIDGLVAKGFLRKKDHSARSIEVVGLEKADTESLPDHEAWLVLKMRKRLQGATSSQEKKAFETTLTALGIDPTELGDGIKPIA